MQVKKNDGSYGQPMPLTKESLENALKDKDTKHVEVFEGTPEEMQRRRQMAKFFSVKNKRFNKKGR
jgi:uncharacterized protein (DUF488 family)